MKRNRKTAALLASITFLAWVTLAALVYFFLPRHTQRIALAVGLGFGGLIVANVLYAIVIRLPEKLWVRMALWTLFLVVLLSPLESMLINRITYSRFGLTVYGLVPIPFLDITVNQNGFLWFRDKTHLITRAEIERLVTPEVEVVVIGNGWHGVARLADDVAALRPNVEIRVLSTPKAFELYNSLVSQGRAVVLLAHSTC